ncbi:Uncharacterized protein Adt_23916 [Abeliophyllum distichum]|uniref:Retrotransposon Copia-like N-terminal domain-containing protein n=1 Tax=Abeliophyllum distichum TaxID=126358 RepID=A0ABD1SC91_9LAMI
MVSSFPPVLFHLATPPGRANLWLLLVPSNSETNSTVPATTNSSSTAQVPVHISNFAPFGMNLTQAASVKLDKNNFLLWKNVIMPIVRGHGLEGYLLGTNECPLQIISTQITTEAGVMVRSSPHPEYSRWMSVDQLLMGWLYSSMSSEIVMRVMGCNSSTGKKIEHTDLVTQVLARLDEEYTPIVVQVNSKDQISWHELSSTLMTFESRLEYLSQVRSSFGSINLTQGNPQNASSYGGRGSNFRAEQEVEADLEDQMKQETHVRYVA